MKSNNHLFYFDGGRDFTLSSQLFFTGGCFFFTGGCFFTVRPVSFEIPYDCLTGAKNQLSASRLTNLIIYSSSPGSRKLLPGTNCFFEPLLFINRFKKTGSSGVVYLRGAAG